MVGLCTEIVGKRKAPQASKFLKVYHRKSNIVFFYAKQIYPPELATSSLNIICFKVPISFFPLTERSRTWPSGDKRRRTDHKIRESLSLVNMEVDLLV
jgi:hypothetical protein